MKHLSNTKIQEPLISRNRQLQIYRFIVNNDNQWVLFQYDLSR